MPSDAVKSADSGAFEPVLSAEMLPWAAGIWLGDEVETP